MICKSSLAIVCLGNMFITTPRSVHVIAKRHALITSVNVPLEITICTEIRFLIQNNMSEFR